MVNQLAVSATDLTAGVAYYGVAPPLDQVANIKAALILTYAGLDDRVNATRPPYEAALKKAGISYTAYVYDGANHAFNDDTNAYATTRPRPSSPGSARLTSSVRSCRPSRARLPKPLLHQRGKHHILSRSNLPAEAIGVWHALPSKIASSRFPTGSCSCCSPRSACATWPAAPSPRSIATTTRIRCTLRDRRRTVLLDLLQNSLSTGMQKQVEIDEPEEDREIEIGAQTAWPVDIGAATEIEGDEVDEDADLEEEEAEEVEADAEAEEPVIEDELPDELLYSWTMTPSGWATTASRRAISMAGGARKH